MSLRLEGASLVHANGHRALREVSLALAAVGWVGLTAHALSGSDEAWTRS